MKKVFLLIPTLSQGGCERVVSELSCNLPDTIESTIVLFEKKISFPYKGRIIDLKTPFSTNPIIHVRNFVLRLIRFRRLLKEEKPDYVVSFINTANIVNILTNRKKAIVRVDVALSEVHNGLQGWFFNLFVRRFFPKAKLVVAASEGVAYDLATYFNIPKGKIQVISNPINIERVRELFKEPLEPEYQKIFDSGPVFITLGRLVNQKAQWHIIWAFQKVKRVVPDAKLIVLGEGHLRNRLTKLIGELGLQDDVYLLGWQNNPFRFLSRAHLFVLSSHLEGLGIVILEAMACGIPVVSSDCKYGPREIIAPKTDYSASCDSVEVGEYGVLTPVDEDVLLAKAMLMVHQDVGLHEKLRQNSQERVRYFQMERVMRDWSALLTF